MAKATRKSAVKAKTETSKKSAIAKSNQATEELHPERDLMGMPQRTWVGGLRKAKSGEARSGRRGHLIALGPAYLSKGKLAKNLRALVTPHLKGAQLEAFLASESESQFFYGSQGPLWVLRLRAETTVSREDQAALAKSPYARLRDLAGATVAQFSSHKIEKLVLEFHGLSISEERGALVGLELACYSFNEHRGHTQKSRRRLPSLLLKTASEMLSEREVKSAAQIGLSVNIARHFVNLPPNELNPRSYAEMIVEMFKKSSATTVDVWHGERLREERMNLLLAVGGAAAEQPRFVHLRYRPKSAPLGLKPIAVVGKGITFDSGGLDIKPSSGMRLMKKDMGGSAACIAIAHWADQSHLPIPLDIYVSLAENAIGSRALRPSDVITARSGLSVEIHNTDAEGRLVLADALDVAVSQTGDNEPQAVIDLATLTGAIKVGLGADIAGLFSNNNELALQLHESGLAQGDLMWRMPLFQPYKSSLKSGFADYSNCSEGGFGGAITAALFLELFVRDVPWAHLDIYAWKDSASGAWSEAGGSGQPVQALAEFFSRLAESTPA